MLRLCAQKLIIRDIAKRVGCSYDLTERFLLQATRASR